MLAEGIEATEYNINCINIYGVERMTISILAAAISYFAIQTELIFGLAKNISNPLIGYLFFSILAGFSETLVPNILTKIEKET